MDMDAAALDDESEHPSECVELAALNRRRIFFGSDPLEERVLDSVLAAFMVRRCSLIFVL